MYYSHDLLLIHMDSLEKEKEQSILLASKVVKDEF